MPTPPSLATTTAATTKIRHNHNLNYQTRPSREVLRALPGAGLRIILFPREAGTLPLVEDVVDEVFAETGVDLSGLRLMGTGSLGNSLREREGRYVLARVQLGSK